MVIHISRIKSQGAGNSQAIESNNGRINPKQSLLIPPLLELILILALVLSILVTMLSVHQNDLDMGLKAALLMERILELWDGLVVVKIY